MIRIKGVGGLSTKITQIELGCFNYGIFVFDLLNTKCALATYNNSLFICIKQEFNTYYCKL